MLHDPVVQALIGVCVAVGIGVAYWYYELRKLEKRKKESGSKD